MHNIELSDKEFTIKYPGILNTLLIDRTTKENLIYATSSYLNKGHLETDYIDMRSLINSKKSLIRPRIEKSKAEQKERSKDKAEVFTPSWICNLQNNQVDDEWFGYKNTFNIEEDKSWKTTEKVDFKDRDWKDYIDLERLEITCGEAPYLVSRYDATSGEEMEVLNRIGLLDRKLRVIYENTETEEDFVKYSYIAYKRIYGFDFQGDNVLLARKNLFYDFIEFYSAKFSKEPSIEILKEIAKIISYNIFQMDGLKFVIPFSCHKEEITKLPLFEELMEESNSEPDFCCGCRTGNNFRHNGIYVTIKDWKKHKIIRFIDIEN